MRPLKLKALRAGLGPFAAEVEVSASERDLLHPLFVGLRDKRALLYAHHGRADAGYVTESIKAIRSELTTTLKALAPESSVSESLERLRQACREYLDAVAESQTAAGTPLDFTEALGQLRHSFREVAELVASNYELPSARALADEMESTDHELEHVEYMPGSAPVGPALIEESAPSGPEPASVESQPVARLLKALTDHDGMVRLNAMLALGDHLSEKLLPMIEPLLGDRDSTIRSYAVDYYAKLNPPDCTSRLVDAMSDHDGMVRLNAMLALSDHLSTELLPMIEPLLEDQDSTIRSYAVDYYAKLNPPDCAARIVAALADHDDMVRLNAMLALGDHLSEKLLPTIEPLLGDRDSTIRSYAVDYYAKLTR